MARKRAVPVDSDHEGSPEGSQVSKRARTEGNSDVELQERKPDIKGKRRRAAEDDVDEDEEDDVVGPTTPDEDEEKKFEEEHEEEIREKLMSKGKTQGGVAEMGIIEHIEMHHFMCHKFLTFSFGPQINFIIGHNGSGKSAVLSALTVALGGKATSTGRGSGLKSFIREGQPASEVTVTLKNQGEEAYKLREYGKSIVITRRFTKDGSSSYKIKSKDGRVISTKREELSAICDHMNIQVDNPMNILTQDSARQFLSASQPADKYRFFLRGTQLSQLSEEYQTCLENISQTQKVLKRKSEVIPDLEQALEEAMTRFQEAAKAREQRYKADELKKELAWAHVATKETELKTQLEAVAKLEHRLPKIQEELEKSQIEFDKASQTVAKFEQDLHDLGEVEELIAQKTAVQSKLRDNKTKISKLKDDERNINSDIPRLNARIASLEKNITDELARVESNTQGKREEIQRKLQTAQADLEAAERRLEEIRAQRPAKVQEAEDIKKDGESMGAECENTKKNIMAAEAALRQCNEAERNKLAPYGPNMDRVLADIKQAKWHGQIPLGPLGLYVGLKEKDYAGVIRSQLGGAMMSFAVTDARDHSTLNKILKQQRCDNCRIIISGVDLFDYSAGEPPSQFLTVLRALEVSDPFVLRILINQSQIEGLFLARNRKEADEMLLSYGRGGVAWAADLYRVQRFPEGGGQSSTLPSVPISDPRQQMFSSNDGGDKKKLQNTIQELQAQYSSTGKKINDLQSKYNQLQQELSRLTTQEAAAMREGRQLKSIRDALQEELNEDLPLDVQSFQDAKAEAEHTKKKTMTQYEELVRQRLEIEQLQVPLLEEYDRLKAEITDFEGRRNDILKVTDAAVTKRVKAQSAKLHYIGKLEDEQKDIDAANEVANTLQEEFTSWTSKAEEYCERFPNPRKAEDVQRLLEGVQNALREREKRQGASVEDMTVEVNKKKAALDTAKKDLRNMLALNKALRRSVKTRLTKWHEFRRHIALRCKVYFSYHLSNRGYYGKVLFDHVLGTLQLKVQTDDQMGTQTSKEKDPRSLSGGEKSFSTICLLLSLWESIGCPIRCLDEFDVFMDAVNRRISMKMMIDTANASDRKQYVLITPQDMTNISPGNSVRVHRMSDPERGQGTLSL